MVSIKELKCLFILATILGSLLIASPIIAPFFPYHSHVRFSEFIILGSTHSLTNHPFHIKVDEEYTTYLVISNHEGSSAYYKVLAKIRTEAEPAPDPQTATPSPLQSFAENAVLLGHGETWEKALILRFPSFELQDDQISVSELILNGQTIELEKTFQYNSETEGYSAWLFFELWIYDSSAASFKYHNRFVSFQLNLTGTS